VRAGSRRAETGSQPHPEQLLQGKDNERPPNKDKEQPRKSSDTMDLHATTGCAQQPPDGLTRNHLFDAQTGTTNYQLRKARRSPTGGLSNLCDRTSVGIPNPQSSLHADRRRLDFDEWAGAVIERDRGQGSSGKCSVFFRHGSWSRCNSVAGQDFTPAIDLDRDGCWDQG
jgi:hypothetical protein